MTPADSAPAPAAGAGDPPDAAAGSTPRSAGSTRKTESPSKLPSSAGRCRPIVGGLKPWIDGGRVPLKRVVGETVAIEADAFADGHDVVAVALRWRHRDDDTWSSTPMQDLGNDRFRGEIAVDRTGTYRLAVRATIDRMATWHHGLAAKVAAGQDVTVDLLEGAELIEAAARRARGTDRGHLRQYAARLRTIAAPPAAAPPTAAPPAAAPPAAAPPGSPGPVGTGQEAPDQQGPDQQGPDQEAPDQGAPDRGAPDRGAGAVGIDGLAVAEDPQLGALMDRYPDLDVATSVEAATVVVDRELAGAGAWYELFPRSASPDPTRSGTLADVIDRLGYVAGLGFDVVYLPPIHPIGQTARKGPDNTPVAGPGDPGSPWAIGTADGGHEAIHRELGTESDVRRLVAAARGYGMEVALDLAFQCSPDHPWVSQHPQWFRIRPDGTVACAENPPKRYEDVLPLNFETDDWRALWAALADVVRTWIGRGIRVFRVDNPHTKPFRFWEWLIATIGAEEPGVIWLSEAFTRPRVMEHLAKIGFSQSYTYFTWRTTKWEIEEYLTELTATDRAEYFRPNFWPNTPDILPPELQHGGRAAFVTRLVLAATASASYGIYGPVFELQEHEARPGVEEYRHSEKYEVRHWNLDDPSSLAPLIARINQARRDHRALRQNRTLRLQRTDNDHLLAFSKTAVTDSGTDVMLTVVNLDHQWPQSGWIDLDIEALGLGPGTPLVAHDLLSDQTFEWYGPHNYVALDPSDLPAHVLHLQRTGGSR